MAKPTIKFSAVAYDIGGKTGYRPQLEAQNGKYDLDFCDEVVTEKRLAMSAEELLHGVEMLAEVATAKIAEDGRPRGITKLIKWNRFAQGNLESPTSPWNDTCRAAIRAQLMTDATKKIDATFVNVNEGIGVKLNYVAWIGAQTVTNVVKIGSTFAAYGNHMEWLEGDSATLTVGTTAYPLVCTESDVAHAVFAWPAGLAPEAGTEALFEMKTRGGVEEGQVYTSKKTVTILEGVLPVLKKLTLGGVVASIDPSSGDCSVTLNGLENYAGAKGYTADGGTERFTAEIFKNGTSLGEATFSIFEPGSASVTKSGIDEGDTVKVVISVDPKKTDYDPTPAEATGTATK